MARIGGCQGHQRCGRARVSWSNSKAHAYPRSSALATPWFSAVAVPRLSRLEMRLMAGRAAKSRSIMEGGATGAVANDHGGIGSRGDGVEPRWEVGSRITMMAQLFERAGAGGKRIRTMASRC